MRRVRADSWNCKDDHNYIIALSIVCCVFLSLVNGNGRNTGKALESAGVVSSNDMTLEAISCKVAYLMGRGDLSTQEIGNLMCVSLRGEGKSTL